MSSTWFYNFNGQSVGPVSIEVLKQLASIGQLQPASMVWKEGQSNWTPAGGIEGLFAQAAGVCSGNMPAAMPAMAGYPVGAAMHIPYHSAVVAQGKSYSSMAKTAMVLSIIGLFLFGIILGPLSLIFSGIALSGMGRSGNRAGNGAAVAGLILGIVDIIGWLCFIAMMHGSMMY